MIRLVSLGVAGAVVDGGRPGRAWLGASRGGAVDLVSLGLANRLVGNPEDAGAFETSGGLVVEVVRPVVVALAGAVADVRTQDGPPVGWGNPVALPAGAVLRVGRLLAGARSYVAVRGGISATAGGVEVGPEPPEAPATHPAARPDPPARIRLWPGPRLDWFVSGAWHELLRGPYVVTDTSRVGARLLGPEVERARADELPSEGLVEGAVQVPADGRPIVMLADHPTTGGYPVIAVVDPDDVHHVAQLPVGASFRFAAAR